MYELTIYFVDKEPKMEKYFYLDTVKYVLRNLRDNITGFKFEFIENVL